jgi:putative phosphoesterase
MTKVGVISDTHGLIRPAALKALRGSDLILHAGDIGSADVLDALREIAPVTAIRGNNDTDAWARRIPEVIDVRIEQTTIHMLHSLKDLAAQGSASADVVISGHSHKPSTERRDQVLYLNPGSAGPRRFKLPVSVALLSIDGARVRARIVELDV